MSPPRKTRARCQLCDERESKYTCPSSGCLVEYCSVPCYKRHKETSCNPNKSKPVGQDDDVTAANPEHEPQTGDEDTNEVPLRPLTSLKWPYVPEESAYPDPLKRDDPKPLRLAQFEAIATSPAVRAALTAHPGLKQTLREIDGLEGGAREEALQAALGVSRRELGGDGTEGIDEGEREAMRGLAEAIEARVRRGSRAFGLDWE